MAKTSLWKVVLTATTLFGLVPAQVFAWAQVESLDTAAIRPAIPGDANWRMEFSHGRMRIENRSVRDLIKTAYGLSADSQVMNAPAWVVNKHFDANGTFDATATKDIDTGTAEQRNNVIRHLLRGLLMDRFNLKTHDAQVVMPVYALSVSRPGALTKRTEGKPGSTLFGIVGPPGKLEGHSVRMAALASRLTSMKDADERLVIDATGLLGEFDWSLHWKPDLLSATSSASEGDGSSLFTALEEQLGLKLLSKKSKVSAVVIDQVSGPSEN